MLCYVEPDNFQVSKSRVTIELGLTFKRKLVSYWFNHVLPKDAEVLIITLVAPALFGEKISPRQNETMGLNSSPM